MASGGAADRLQSHGVLNTGTTRKVMQVIGQTLLTTLDLYASVYVCLCASLSLPLSACFTLCLRVYIMSLSLGFSLYLYVSLAVSLPMPVSRFCQFPLCMIEVRALH